MEARQFVAERVAEQRGDIEDTIYAEINSSVDESTIVDPEYHEGLRTVVPSALAYGIETVRRAGRAPRVPATVLTQARLAARNGVPLQVVLGRYTAGYMLLSNALFDAIEGADLRREIGVKDLQRTQSVLFKRLIGAVGEEYSRERERPVTTEMERIELAKGLLRGEALDTSPLRYEFNTFHVAVIARGPGAANAIKGLADALGCLSLVIPNGEGAIWAWLGRRERHDFGRLAQLVSSRWPIKASLAIGEPGHGEAGWRRTHQQASAAFALAAVKPERIIRYAEHEFLAAAMQDHLLAKSLYDIYLAPLAKERAGGVEHRETVRAYLAADCNGASVAAALKVSRQTVSNRLRTVEERIGRPLSACAAQMDTALRLDELDTPTR